MKAVGCAAPVGKLVNHPDYPPRKTINPGCAEGMLVGGNLMLITSLLGTPYELDTKGKILFIEEIGELATALNGDDRANLEEEFADVVAWLCTLANINDVDVDTDD